MNLLDVMIYCASGSVGSCAASLRNHYGAHVTMVVSTKHHEKLKSIKGLIISYYNNEYLKVNETYDIIFDETGKINKKSVSNLLKKMVNFTPSKRQLKKFSQDLNSLKCSLKTIRFKQSLIRCILLMHSKRHIKEYMTVIKRAMF